MKITKQQLRKIIQEHVTLMKEDGHTDIPYVARKLRTSIEDSMQMLSKLKNMQSNDDLPTWWIGKITIASTYLSKCRDYLLVSDEHDTIEQLDSQQPINKEDTNDFSSVGEMEYW